MDSKGEIDSNIITERNLSIPLTTMDRLMRQKHRNGITELTQTIEQMDLNISTQLFVVYMQTTLFCECMDALMIDHVVDCKKPQQIKKIYKTIHRTR